MTLTGKLPTQKNTESLKRCKGDDPTRAKTSRGTNKVVCVVLPERIQKAKETETIMLNIILVRELFN